MFFLLIYAEIQKIMKHNFFITAHIKGKETYID